MDTNPMKEFKRLFYKLYFCDMDVQEVLELVLCIDSLSGMMLENAEKNPKVKELDEDLKVFGEQLLDLVREA